jgi:hypothetical protein
MEYTTGNAPDQHEIGNMASMRTELNTDTKDPSTAAGLYMLYYLGVSSPLTL